MIETFETSLQEEKDKKEAIEFIECIKILSENERAEVKGFIKGVCERKTLKNMTMREIRT